VKPKTVVQAVHGSWARYWVARRERSGERDIWWALDRTKFEWLRRHLPPGGTSLEVGCGSARLSTFVGAEGYRVVGLDYCVEAAALAQTSFARTGVRGDVAMGDALRLPFRDNSVDIVLSTGLLEHFEDPAPVVREMVRVLRPGGLFYSDVVPKKFSLMCALDGIRKGQRNHEGIPEHAVAARQLLTLLGRSGLGAVRVVPAGVFPPRLPILDRIRALREARGLFCYATRRFWSALDGTPLAERLGVFYLCLGRKTGVGQKEDTHSEKRVIRKAHAGRATTAPRR
jgi:SAM-dependent methyltransferase